MHREETLEDVRAGFARLYDENFAGKTPSRLKVKGLTLVDENDQIVMLRGLSTHGLQWFPQYYNKDVFKTLRDSWATNVVRLAMYVEEDRGFTLDGGFNSLSYKKMIEGIDACLELGLYCIVDWHVSNADQTPRKHWGEARDFFKTITSKYGNHPQILYEICNEPNQSGNDYASQIADYADDMIRSIREKAPDAVVIIGSPMWSSQPMTAFSWDKANRGGRKNVLYTMHHYCQGDFDQWSAYVRTAVAAGCPIIATECGVSDAEEHNWEKAEEFKQVIALYEELDISWQVWSLADKVEPTSVLMAGAPGNGEWTDANLTKAGVLVRDLLKRYGDIVVPKPKDPAPEPTPAPTPAPAPAPATCHDWIVINEWRTSAGVVQTRFRSDP